MEITHHVAFNDTSSAEDVVNSLGVDWKKTPLPGKKAFLGTFDILESDPRWPVVAEIIQEKGLLDIAFSIFTPEEVLAAEWVRLLAGYEQGYPQPERKWKALCYEGDCPKCGSGFVQKASFHISKEPRQIKYTFMSLYWAGAFLVPPVVFDSFEAAQLRGYEKWPVLIHRTGQPSQAVAQLYVPQIARPGLIVNSRLEHCLCDVCGRRKFVPIKIGWIKYRRDALPNDTDFAVTNEWFGYGAQSYRETLISNRVARIIIEQGWKGATLQPVELCQL